MSREFWAYKGNSGLEITSLPISFNDGTKVYHLVEKSAHEAATARLMSVIEKAVEMAEYYGGDQNKKIGDKRLWEILTYDDCGKKAREFLNMIKDEVRVK